MKKKRENVIGGGTNILLNDLTTSCHISRIYARVRMTSLSYVNDSIYYLKRIKPYKISIKHLYIYPMSLSQFFRVSSNNKLLLIYKRTIEIIIENRNKAINLINIYNIL